MSSTDRVLDRIERLLTRRIRPAIWPERIPVSLAAWRSPERVVDFSTAVQAGYQPFTTGTRWGAAWETWWFRLDAEIPVDWRGRTIELVIDPGFIGDWPGGQVEGLLRDQQGHTLKAINPRNNTWRLPADTGRLAVFFEACAIPDVMAEGWTVTEQGDIETAGPEPLYAFASADLATFDEQVWGLYFDIEVLWQLARELPETDPRRHTICTSLTHAADIVDWRGVAEGAVEGRAALAGELSKPSAASAHSLSAVGHAHIDCAWLWPVEESVRKASRTFANVLDLASHYDDFRFACSSALHYEWVEQTNPELFARIRQAVADGTWYPVCGMWVEPDGNLPSGESLVRQMAYGQRYSIKHFGEPSSGMWIPDSFGYSAAYPQLAKLAGMDWFLTQKISWNQTNRFPHHTFWWEGLDGTRLFTHFAPVDNYVSTLEGHELAHASRNFTEHGRSSSSLVPFGYGDGGGGPVRDMMERYRRVRDLEGSPKVTIEHPRDFFVRARAEYPDAPVWVGELYLELHRGTFTSQARGKYGNRRVESLLHTAEWLWTLAAQRDVDFPVEAFDGWWKRLLLHQFHDILPGSSIAWVHREAHADLAALITEVTASTEQACAFLSRDEMTVANPSPVARREVVDIAGEPRLIEVDAYAIAPADEVEVRHPIQIGDDGRVGNGLVSFALADDVTFESVRDELTGRELLGAGQRGNVLRIHPDHPSNWDAWDVDAHYRNRCGEVTGVDSFEVVESSPLRYRARVVRRFGDSTFTQILELTADSNKICIHTTVDWRWRERFLKQHWSLGVRAAESQAEVQFGHIARPTHSNTSWQEAAFELYAHRWLRLCEPGFGIALATDASYGYDIQRVLDANGEVCTEANLSLLRAPNFPDPRADLGVHEFTCTISPAADVADAIAAGYALNQPLVVSRAATRPPVVRASAGYVETVVASHDDSGDVIVRLYEGTGARVSGVLETDLAASLEVVDLLERPMNPRSAFVADGPRAEYTLQPFEVLTVKVKVAR